MYFSILNPPFVYSFAVVSSGFDVNHSWLQNGYKKVEEPLESLKYVDYVDEKWIINAFYHRKLMSVPRVGIGVYLAITDLFQIDIIS